MAEHGSDLRDCVRAAITALVSSGKLSPNDCRIYRTRHATVISDFAQRVRGARGSLGAVLTRAEAQRPVTAESWLVAQIARCMIGKITNDKDPKLNGTPITIQ